MLEYIYNGSINIFLAYAHLSGGKWNQMRWAAPSQLGRNWSFPPQTKSDSASVGDIPYSIASNWNERKPEKHIITVSILIWVKDNVTVIPYSY